MSLNLSIASPTSSIVTAVDLAVLQLQAVLTDDNSVSRKFVELTYDWGDGSTSVQIRNISNSEGISISTEHQYPPGTYTLTLEARNFLEPEAERIATSFSIFVTSSQQAQNAVLFGPILPLDNGHPNKQEWALDRGEDIKVLVSSVKMLLLTARGERLMRPEYGTDIRRKIFELSTVDLEGFLSQQITTALAQWEPRVALNSFTVTRENRNAFIDITCVSRLTGRMFSVGLEF